MESVDRPVSFENNTKPGRDTMNRKGFTLIELLIVVVIIGILAAIAIPRFGETRERAYVSAMQSDLNQLRTEMELCYQDSDFTYVGCDEEIINESVAVTVAVAGQTATGWTATADHDGTDWGCAYDSEVGVIGCDAAGSAAALAALGSDD